MGREIRRVPAGWRHPKDGDGYKPMRDKTYKQAADKWIAECVAWQDGTGSDAAKYKGKYLYCWEWIGSPPDKEYYRPGFVTEPTHYQIYETVSEGTPTSPVFETLEDMKAWLIKEGHSEHAASMFAKNGWAPSMIVNGGKVSEIGIDSLDALPAADG